MTRYGTLSGVSSAVERFGARVRELREAKGLSRRDLAHASGLSEPLLEKLESASPSNPRRQTVLRLTRALGMDTDEALVQLGLPPRTEAEIAEAEQGEDPWETVARLWPELSASRQRAVAMLVRVMVSPEVLAQAPVVMEVPEGAGVIPHPQRRPAR